MISNDEAENLRVSITRMIRFLKSEPDAAGPAASLNLSDVIVLCLVGTRPGCIMRDVAEELGSALSTATTVVDRLVRQGLIARQRNEENRRVVMLDLTGPGAELYGNIVQEQQKQCTRMLLALEPYERALYLALMVKIARATQKQNDT